MQLMPFMATSATLRIAYHGPALVDHQIDVQDLAPALMGLGDIFKEANRLFNDDKCTIRVVVTPDIEKKCFDIALKVIQDNWAAIGSLFTHDHITKAAEIIDWMIRGAFVGSGCGGLLWLLVHAPRPMNIIEFKDENGNKMYRYQYEKKDDLILDHKQHIVFQNKTLRKDAKKLLTPVINNPGIVDFYAYKKERKDGTHVTKKQAQEIEFVFDADFVELPQESDNNIEAWLQVYSPVYDMKSTNLWRFWYGENHHYMDVDGSGIKELVMHNGGALIGDKFRVKLSITQEEKDDKIINHYKIIQVMEFQPAARQRDLLYDAQEASKPKGSDSEG